MEWYIRAVTMSDSLDPRGTIYIGYRKASADLWRPGVPGARSYASEEVMACPSLLSQWPQPKGPPAPNNHSQYDPSRPKQIPHLSCALDMLCRYVGPLLWHSAVWHKTYTMQELSQHLVRQNRCTFFFPLELVCLLSERSRFPPTTPRWPPNRISRFEAAAVQLEASAAAPGQLGGDEKFICFMNKPIKGLVC